jgi:hypothetical protein
VADRSVNGQPCLQLILQGAQPITVAAAIKVAAFGRVPFSRDAPGGIGCLDVFAPAYAFALAFAHANGISSSSSGP